ncbi:MAG: DegT/DnrJ/EryC1/StrS family aminotransferase [Chitinispirillaceae bacterium]|nr:DegT/DnrJ/EryC1/StrS family aminotransferase [Chitinispirillaceae bacterium]
MNIPMTDLSLQYSQIKTEINDAILRVIESGYYIMGDEVEELEKEIAAFCNTKYAISVASGTDALILSLKACGIQPGDEVITTPFTFTATVEAISHCGAIPVFVDIDLRTFNIDVTQIENEITPHTKAIIPVHLFGQPAEMNTIMDISRRFNIRVIEDCAQAFGAEYKGKKAGSIGDVGCLSFFPSKNLGAYGDGGMVVTNDLDVAESIKILRNHGTVSTYHHKIPGYNSRLDAVQAAILRVKLKNIDRWIQARRQATSMYTKLLEGIEGIKTAKEDRNVVSAANYYTIRTDSRIINREKLREYLTSNQIDTAVYYPLSLHLQQAYQYLGYFSGDFPGSEIAQEQVLSLPLFPEITREQIIVVVNNISEYLFSNKYSQV